MDHLGVKLDALFGLISVWDYPFGDYFELELCSVWVDIRLGLSVWINLCLGHVLFGLISDWLA